MRQSGATLLELIVVMAVSAILLGLSIPSFSSYSSNSRLSGVTNEIVSSLHLARSEAIKRSSRTVMCISATGTSCAASGDWHQGWLIFHDANNNAALDAGETVIQFRKAMPAGFRLTGNDHVSQYISYAPDGGTKMTSGAWQAGTLTVCNESALSYSRKIIINKTGRPRTVKVVLASCP
jgi:type IV fimbrial biogenesis protein FimT